MFLNCLFDLTELHSTELHSTKNKLDCDRCEDYIERFCKDLTEDAMKTIN